MTTDPFTPPPVLPTGTTARRRRMPLWVKVLLGTVTGVVLLTVGVVLYFVAAFSGGFDDLVAFGKPQQDDKEVVRAGDTAEREIEVLHRQLTQAVSLTDTGVRVSSRGCYEGQHNWKIDDPYDLDCSASRGSVLALRDLPAALEDTAVTAEIARLDAALVGWQREEPSLNTAVSTEPGARWTRGGNPLGEAGVQQVTLQVLRAEGRRVQAYELGPYDATITRDGREVDPSAVLTGRRFAVLTVSERYFYD